MTKLNKCIFVALVAINTIPAFSNGFSSERVSKKDTFPLHDNVRTLPYPRAEHELYLNPSPLLVPKTMQTADLVQFSLSQTADFTGKSTIVSKPVAWSMFSPHKILAPGTWYWRFRSVGKNDKGMNWSKTYSFTVKNETPKFATPPFKRLVAGIPASYPRMYVFLKEGFAYAQKHASEFPEYKELIRRVNGAMKLDYKSKPDGVARISALTNAVFYLHQAFCVTGERMYSDKLVEMGRSMADVADDPALQNDFMSGDYCLQLLNVYDVCYDQLTATDRKNIEKAVINLTGEIYRGCLDNEENHIFDNHFWQLTIRQLFQTGVMFHDKYPIAHDMLEYCYELWTTRGPGGGFIMDGSWNYGTGYFNVDINTNYYFPAALSYFTGYNFLNHPWYKEAGKALCYIWPPNSYSPGFGDGHEGGVQPSRGRVGLADFLARETGDPYAAWYVNECERTAKPGNRLTDDILLRLYRFANLHRPYKNPGLPLNHPKLMWFKDCGEVEAHSDIANTNNSLFLSFRSSPYGSGSHTLADQNSFNLHYKGLPVYRSTGLYWNFCDPHNLLSYRHTRAHNTLLIDGIGQPFTTRAYGEVLRAFDGKNISYCLGDASNAYCGTSEYSMWIKNFKNANITQTPENGFGKTPLKLYRRHMLLLHPDKVVIYDELEAEKPVRWDWLLHSPVQFQIDAKENKLTTINEKSGFQSVAQLFCNQVSTISQTDQYVAAPDQKFNKNKTEISPEWHLTASFSSSKKNRILTVIQVTPNGVMPVAIEKLADGNYKCGDWRISAELNCEKPASMNIQNKAKNVLFSYGADQPIINGKKFNRKQPDSSLLYDEFGGQKKVEEMSDHQARATR